MQEGAPLEDMLLLANVVAADPWFCIPHLADEDYILQFAQAVRDGLRPDRKAYIEYSNELWHTGFPGGQYAEAQAARLGTSRLCFVVARLRNISRIFQGVFGPAGRGRFVPVLSSMTVNADATQQLLACGIGAPGEDVDAIALGPYFEGHAAGKGDVDGMLASYEQALNATLKQVRLSRGLNPHHLYLDEQADPPLVHSGLRHVALTAHFAGGGTRGAHTGARFRAVRVRSRTRLACGQHKRRDRCGPARSAHAGARSTLL